MKFIFLCFVQLFIVSCGSNTTPYSTPTTTTTTATTVDFSGTYKPSSMTCYNIATSGGKFVDGATSTTVATATFPNSSPSEMLVISGSSFSNTYNSTTCSASITATSTSYKSTSGSTSTGSTYTTGTMKLSSMSASYHGTLPCTMPFSITSISGDTVANNIANVTDVPVSTSAQGGFQDMVNTLNSYTSAGTAYSFTYLYYKDSAGNFGIEVTPTLITNTSASCFFMFTKTK